MLGTLIFLCVVAVGLEVYFIFEAFRRSRWENRIEHTPTSKIGEITDGYRQIKGRVVPTADEDKLLTAPMSGRRCVYYEFKVTEEIPVEGGGTRVIIIIREGRNAGFVLDDGSGVANIDPGGAELLLKADRHERSGRGNPATSKQERLLAKHQRSSSGMLGSDRDLDYYETMLEEGDELRVLGPAKVVEGRVCFKATSGQPFVLSYKSGVLLRQWTARSSKYVFGAVLLPIAVVALIVFSLLSQRRGNEVGIRSSDDIGKQAIAEIKRLGGRVSPVVDGVSVSFTNGQVTDAGMEHLKEVANLRSLQLTRTQVTDTGLKHLKGMTNIRFLVLYGTPVTDTGLEHLEGLTNLQILNLTHTQVTDAGLEHLKGMTLLEKLYLRDTQVTDEGIKKLQQSLPNCTIHR